MVRPPLWPPALALTGSDLGPVTEPLLIDLLRGEVPPDQVRRPPPALAGWVVDLRFFLARAARCCSRIRPATAFSFTRQPSSRRSSVIRGEPYLPWCSSKPLGLGSQPPLRAFEDSNTHILTDGPADSHYRQTGRHS
jgi:hypothetical protein